LLVLIVVLVVGSGDVRARILRSRLFVLSLIAALSTLLVLVNTALWDQHIELLAFPLLCVAALAVEGVRAATRRLSGSLGENLAVGFLAGGCLLVAAWPDDAVANLRRWGEPPQTNVSDALQQGAQVARVSGSPVPFAHLGANDEQAAAAFLSPSFRLACPRFHQYPFTPPRVLHETIGCLRKQPSLLVAVTPTFAQDSYTYWQRGTPPAWHWFVHTGNSYLRSNCRPLTTKPAVRVYHCSTRGDAARP
jgi:hypothetical protein